MDDLRTVAVSQRRLRTENLVRHDRSLLIPGAIAKVSADKASFDHSNLVKQFGRSGDVGDQGHND